MTGLLYLVSLSTQRFAVRYLRDIIRSYLGHPAKFQARDRSDWTTKAGQSFERPRVKLLELFLRESPILTFTSTSTHLMHIFFTLTSLLQRPNLPG